MVIKIETTINAPINKVWECWTTPEHITKWNFASPDWCCPSATNDLKPNGTFSWRMEAKDGSMAFDYTGTYKEVIENKSISLELDDNRIVKILFAEENGAVKITEEFEAEDENNAEMQRQGWQAILNNFKAHVESNA